MIRKLRSGAIWATLPSNSRGKGFFLIEVLILLLILSIVAVPLIYSLHTILRAFQVSNDFTKSIYLGEMVLFQEIKNPGTVDVAKEFDPPNEGFSWELKRTPLQDDLGLYEVRVKVKDSRMVYAELGTLVKEK